MSSSFRNVSMFPRWHSLAGLAAVAGSAVLALPAMAAQVYVQPIATVSAETDSNIDLDTDTAQRVEGYAVDAATVIGVATPKSDSTIRPRIRYADYPKETALNATEGSLDFNSRYRSQRSNFYIFGRYDHLLETNAEVPAAQFNEVNPDQPTAPETGRVQAGVTRDNLLVSPRYLYSVSPRFGFGASGVFQTVSFSPADTTDYVNFDYYEGSLFATRSLGPRTDLSVGAFGNRYSAGSIRSSADAGGASLDLDMNWTQLMQSTLSASYQHTNITTGRSVVVHESANNWSAAFNTAAHTPTGVFRFNIGRSITPSGGGGLYAAETAQVQYDKNLSPRLTVTGAALYTRTRGLSVSVRGNDRNAGRGDLSFKWMATRTWFLLGGYSYFTQKYVVETDSAANNQFYVRVGYQGLPRQQ